MATYLEFALLLMAIALFFLVFLKLHFLIKKNQIQLFHEKNNNKNTLIGKTELLLAKKAPGFSLKSIDANIYDLESLAKEGIILVFSDTACPHCTPTLETFLAQIKNYPDQKFVLISKENNDHSNDSLYELYDGRLFILRATDKVFEDYKIDAIPTFIYVNKYLTIESVSLFSEDIFHYLHLKEKSVS